MLYPRILELSWPTAKLHAAPQAIVVAYSTRDGKRRRHQLSVFQSFSDQTPIKYIKCASAEEAYDLASLDIASLGGGTVLAASNAEEVYEEDPSYEAKVTEAQKRHMYDEVVTKLCSLILRGSRIEQDALGRRVEVLEVHRKDANVITVIEPSPLRSGDKRKRSASSRTTAPAAVSFEPHTCVYYSVDIGLQRQIQVAAGDSRVDSVAWQSAARSLVTEEFQTVETGGFLDMPIAVAEPLPEVYSRGVLQPQQEGLAVDEALGEFFDDYKDLARPFDEDNQSIDYSDSSSSNRGRTSSFEGGGNPLSSSSSSSEGDESSWLHY